MIVGIVGKANVGKSTFFKALTLADVEIANYPFATVKPNNGIGFVKTECVDKEFNVECQPREGVCKHGHRFVPVKVVDVAGLVPGAHEGKGLGNQFLSDLNQADVLIHVIDAAGSTNDKGEPVDSGTYDPVNDVKFLEVELDFWYLDILKKGWEKFMRRVQAEHITAANALFEQMSGVGVTEDMAKQGVKNLNPQMAKWTEEELLVLAKELRIKTKPMIIAANKADIPGAMDNIARLQKEFPDHTIIPVSAEAELALKEADHHGWIDYVPGEGSFALKDNSKMSDKQKHGLDFLKKYLDSHKTTGVQECINKAVFDMLKYKVAYPVANPNLTDSDGRILPDCFLLPPQATTIDFAFKVHSDIGKNFVKAMNMKTKMPVGKDSLIEHRDVIEIMTKK
ncbi:redox-regulated ATPase YchF [Nanoarchaeota archaeon]